MPSKHVNAAPLIRRGLYDGLHSFAELEQRISALGDENTKIVGDALEIFVEGYLATHQKMQSEAVWLVGQVPLDIREQLNLPNDTKGIDGIFRTRTGTLVPYQVKFRVGAEIPHLHGGSAVPWINGAGCRPHSLHKLK
jgi:hypothetical protein